MTDDELIEAIRTRIADPQRRLDSTTSDAPPLYGVATAAAVDAAEAEIGFALPPLLRRVYLEVANGGFGPASGIFGVEGGQPDADGRTLGALYLEFRSWPSPPEDATLYWPEGLLPICEWGCTAWACIDRSHDYIVTMDGGRPTITTLTLAAWLEAWMSGEDLFAETFEIIEGIALNPFTRKPTAVERRGRAKGTHG
jgi:hypothetical protein